MYSITNDICFGRFLGNYCPPRSTKESRLKELEMILQLDKKIEPNTLWVLNRVYDQDYLDTIKSILTDNNQQYYEIPFVYNEFDNISNTQDKVRYVFNLNNARNTLVSRGLEQYKYTICADGDLYMEPERYAEMCDNITCQAEKQYYMLWHHRTTHSQDDSSVKKMSVAPVASTCHSVEPVPVFTRHSKQFFDERLYYNDNCKNELCFRIGMKHANYLAAASNMHKSFDMSLISESTDLSGDDWTTAGVIYHLALSGQERQETHVSERSAARRTAIQTALSRVEQHRPRA